MNGTLLAKLIMLSYCHDMGASPSYSNPASIIDTEFSVARFGSNPAIQQSKKDGMMETDTSCDETLANIGKRNPRRRFCCVWVVMGSTT